MFTPLRDYKSADIRWSTPRFRTRVNRLACGCLFVVLGAMLAGCGGSADDGGSADSGNADSNAGNDAGSSAAADSNTTESAAGDSGQPSASGNTASEATGPESGAGLQLPDEGLPSSDSPEPDAGGPAKPGTGGIEMPELNLPSGDDETSSTGPVKANNVDLKFASWKEIESHAKSTGKITVVDLWSTVCEPCVKEFPGLVRLSKSMDDVSCIGVSVDYDGRKSRPPETYTERVSGFLSAVGAEFDNFLCNTPSDDVFAAVGLPSIPAVLIYDDKGELIKQFIDSGDTIGFSYDKDIIPFVKKLAG